MTTTALHAPISGYCDNPIAGMQAANMLPVRIGSRVRDLAPQTRDLLVCRLNGEWLSRTYWDETVGPGDVVEWFAMPQGKDTLRLVLTLAVIVFMWWNPLGWGAAGMAAFGAAATLAINILLPIRPPDPAAGPGSVYSASLNGNMARVDQPIWKLCGRVKVTPPFAAAPYLRYLPSDPANPHADCDQYYYALFAIGIGDHEIERAFIGKTPLRHFRDVLRADYLPPGVQPSEVLATVVTSDEVSGFELNDQGKYAGPVIACRPGDKASEISVDVHAPQGLGWADSDDTITAVWQVEAREVNDFGVPIGEWQILGTTSRTAQTNTPQRWTVDYELATPIRPQIRVARMDDRIEHPAARDSITWNGLRATLAKAAPLNADCAHFEVVMRSSEQLSSTSQRDFSMIVRALVRPLLADGTRGAPVFSRNPADWLADLWLSTTWGERFEPDRVATRQLYAWGQTCLRRQDRFDYAFVSGGDAWAAAQLIARVGRARAFERNGVRSVVRDELVTLPQRALTARNTQPGSMRYASPLPRRERADGVVVEFQSNITWDTASIECPCPGFSVSNPDDPRFDPALPPMESPTYIKLEGVTGAKHAEREGLYEAANLALRPATVAATVEMEGAVFALMEAVRWQPPLRGYGQAGEVTSFDPATNTLRLSDRPAWGARPLQIVLQRDDLSLTDPAEVAPGPGPNDVVLPNPPGFALVTNAGGRERPKYLIGADGDELAKITDISDAGQTEDGAQLYRVEALVDDDRVHLADVHLLPGPGDQQDPIDDSGELGVPDDSASAGAALPVLVQLVDHVITGGNNIPTGPDRGGVLTFRLFANGTAGWDTSWTINDGATPVSYGGLFPGEWLRGAPVEPATAAEYEVRVLLADPAERLTMAGVVLTGTFDAWVPMTVDQAWTATGGESLPPNPEFTISCRVQIRRVGGEVVLAERALFLTFVTGDTSQGGGS